MNERNKYLIAGGMNLQQYLKRISRDEVDRRAVLVLKSALKFFPPEDDIFEIIIKKQHMTEHMEACIVAEKCECRGPDKPHSHYFIDLLPLWNDIALHPGDILRLRKENEKGKTYELIVE